MSGAMPILLMSTPGGGVFGAGGVGGRKTGVVCKSTMLVQSRGGLGVPGAWGRCVGVKDAGTGVLEEGPGR